MTLLGAIERMDFVGLNLFGIIGRIAVRQSKQLGFLRQNKLLQLNLRMDNGASGPLILISRQGRIHRAPYLQLQCWIRSKRALNALQISIRIEIGKPVSRLLDSLL